MEETNKLIMSFMGVIGEVPAYDKDWNLLVPVIQKIKSTLVKLNRERRREADNRTIITHYSILALNMETAYPAVTGFIEWFKPIANLIENERLIEDAEMIAGFEKWKEERNNPPCQ